MTRVRVLNTAHPGGTLLRYRLLKLLQAAVWPLRAAAAFGDGFRTVYYVPAGGLGVLAELPVLAVVRLFGCRIFIHHHSYAYLAAASPLHLLAFWLVRRSSTHVCLSDSMLADLQTRYPCLRARGQALSNAAFCDDHGDSASRGDIAPINVGFLSNLTAEKGIYVACKSMQVLQSQSGDLRFTIAGGCQDPALKTFIDALAANSDGKVVYLGPVYGRAKAKMFRSLDLFIFPTLYKNEASPLVLFEALSHGVPVVAIQRGAIRDIVEPAGLPVADCPPSFEHLLGRTLNQLRADPVFRRRLARQARSAFVQDRAQALERLDRLIETMAGVPSASESGCPPRGGNIVSCGQETVTKPANMSTPATSRYLRNLA